MKDAVLEFAAALLEWSACPGPDRREALMRAGDACRADQSIWPPLMRLGINSCDMIIQSHEGHPRLKDLRQVACAVGAALLADRRRQKRELVLQEKRSGLIVDLEVRRGTPG